MQLPLVCELLLSNQFWMLRVGGEAFRGHTRLIPLFELKDLLDGFLERPGNFQHQDAGGDKAAALDGVDRLAAHSDLFGQLLLGDADNGPLNPDVILHGSGCVWNGTGNNGR